MKDVDQHEAGLPQEIDPLVLQAPGLEVTKRLHSLIKASLAGSSLMLPYYIWGGRLRGASPSADLAEIAAPWGRLEEDSVHEFAQEWPRAMVVAGMAVLETYFKSMTQLGRKSAVRSPRSRRSNLTPTAKARPREGYGLRLDRLRELYGVPLAKAETFLPEIESAACLRNAIAHDASLYELREASPGRFYSSPKPLPEATTEDALEVLMLVTEFADSIFVEVFEHLVGRPPEVRPLTPAISEAHRHQRERRRAKEARPPEIERLEAPEWTFREYPGGGGHAVMIQDSRVWVTPTGIPALPALFTVIGHKAHGKQHRWQVDGGEWLEPIGKRASIALLDALLNGQEVLIQYFRRSGEGASHLAIPLQGFSVAWEQGSKKK